MLNNPYQSSVAKNSAVGANRVAKIPNNPVLGGGPSSYLPNYKYGGIGGGIGPGAGPSVAADMYGVPNEQSIQGA